MRERSSLAQQFITFLAVAGLVLTSRPAAANEAVYQRVVRSTVLIATPSGSIGAGALIDAGRRLVVTANHVPGNDNTVTVFFADTDLTGRPITGLEHYEKNRDRLGIRGIVIARRPRCDLALIQLPFVPFNAPVLPLASGARQGQEVHAIGHSSVKRGAVFSYSSCGTVRNVLDLPANSRVLLEGRVVETSLPTNKGDSGGPVVNSNCELVAIVSRGTTGAATSAQAPLAEEQVVDLDIDVSEVRTLAGSAGFVLLGSGLRIPWRPLPSLVAPLQAPAPAAPSATPLTTLLNNPYASVSSAPPIPAPRPLSLIGGRWVRTESGPDGRKFTAEFSSDGIYRLTAVNAAGVSVQSSGTYTLVNSRLSLMEGSRKIAEGTVTWQGCDSISIQSETATTTWRR